MYHKEGDFGESKFESLQLNVDTGFGVVRECGNVPNSR